MNSGLNRRLDGVINQPQNMEARMNMYKQHYPQTTFHANSQQIFDNLIDDTMTDQSAEMLA